MAKYKLKRLKVNEVSLVGNPAFQESEWIFCKSAIASIEGLRLTNKPAHKWLDFVEIEGDGKYKVSGLLLTCIVLQEGDKKADGSGRWTIDEIEKIQERWALNGKRNIQQQEDGSTLPGAGVATYGVTGDQPMSITGSDEPVPANTWFVQIGVMADTAKRIVGINPDFTGLEPIEPNIMVRKNAVKMTDDELAGIVDATVQTLFDQLSDIPGGSDVTVEQAEEVLNNSITELLQDA